jgi:hypothetical protein
MGRFTRAEIVGFTVVLVLITMLPMAGRGGAVYLLCMSVAGAFFFVSRGEPRQIDFQNPGEPRGACLSDLFASGFDHHDGLEVVKF